MSTGQELPSCPGTRSFYNRRTVGWARSCWRPAVRGGPAIGRGALWRAVWRGLVLVGPLGAAGCVPAPTPYPQSITGPDPVQRVRGIIRAGETNDAQVVPLLVDRLEDEDEAVRFYAILSLEKIVGTRHGYHYGANEPQRRQAVQRWRDYVAGSGRSGAAPPVAAPN